MPVNPARAPRIAGFRSGKHPRCRPLGWQMGLAFRFFQTLRCEGVAAGYSVPRGQSAACVPIRNRSSSRTGPDRRHPQEGGAQADRDWKAEVSPTDADRPCPRRPAEPRCAGDPSLHDPAVREGAPNGQPDDRHAARRFGSAHRWTAPRRDATDARAHARLAHDDHPQRPRRARGAVDDGGRCGGHSVPTR